MIKNRSIRNTDELSVNVRRSGLETLLFNLSCPVESMAGFKAPALSPTCCSLTPYRERRMICHNVAELCGLV